ncbi:MAG: lysophospholipid acyltransferase family protein [Phycisphaerae bacterium]
MHPSSDPSKGRSIATFQPGYRFFRLIFRIFFLLCGQGRAFGLRRVPRTGAVVLACNHQSYLDPLIAALALRRICDFMGRDTLFRHWFGGGFLRMVNVFPVKRGTGDVGAIKEALRRLKAGAVLVTFPEGTRSPDGRIRPVQGGIVAIARRAKCPIVPTIIEGAYDIWPRGRKWPGLGKVCVEYLDMIPAELLASLDVDQAADLLTRRLRQGHNDLRRRLGREPFDYGDALGAGRDGD